MTNDISPLPFACINCPTGRRLFRRLPVVRQGFPLHSSGQSAPLVCVPVTRHPNPFDFAARRGLTRLPCAYRWFLKSLPMLSVELTQAHQLMTRLLASPLPDVRHTLPQFPCFLSWHCNSYVCRPCQPQSLRSTREHCPFTPTHSNTAWKTPPPYMRCRCCCVYVNILILPPLPGVHTRRFCWP